MHDLSNNIFKEIYVKVAKLEKCLQELEDLSHHITPDNLSVHSGLSSDCLIL